MGLQHTIMKDPRWSVRKRRRAGAERLDAAASRSRPKRPARWCRYVPEQCRPLRGFSGAGERGAADHAGDDGRKQRRRSIHWPFLRTEFGRLNAASEPGDCHVTKCYAALRNAVGAPGWEKMCQGQFLTTGGARDVAARGPVLMAASGSRRDAVMHGSTSAFRPSRYSPARSAARERPAALPPG